MKHVPVLVLFAAVCSLTGFAEEEYQTWRAVGGYKTVAAFVSYDAGVVTLKKKDGETVQVRLERLTPAHRAEVIRLAGPTATGSTPRGQIQAPKGRRELTFERLGAGNHWHKQIKENELSALKQIDRSWNHAETKYFIVHYQKLGYAQRLARMADYLYQYIAADLPGYEDRVKEKSHIVVIQDRDDWKEYLKLSQYPNQWAGGYVRGRVMFIYDMDNREVNAHIVAHEMSHLILNRFFIHRPPLWLNEGLAEWYGHFGWQAFKGQKVNIRRSLGEMDDTAPVSELISRKSYPSGTDAVRKYYATSHQLVGMLKLRKDEDTFVKFLTEVTGKGRPVEEPLESMYGLSNAAQMQEALDEFLK